MEGKPEYTQRRHRGCLGCGKSFMSDHPANRRCPGCSRRLDGVYTPKTFGAACRQDGRPRPSAPDD